MRGEARAGERLYPEISSFSRPLLTETPMPVFPGTVPPIKRVFDWINASFSLFLLQPLENFHRKFSGLEIWIAM